MILNEQLRQKIIICEKFLAVVEAPTASFRPTPGLKERCFESSGFSGERGS